jgi:ABC-2 type transport system permease protein
VRSVTPPTEIRALRTIYLVAIRELRTRLRGRGFQVATAVMLLAVVAAMVVPAMIRSDKPPVRQVGLAGTVPAGLATGLVAQGTATGSRVEPRIYQNVADGEDAVRRNRIDVLVVDGSRLVWRARADSTLRGTVAAAVQLVQARQRAAALGLSDRQLAELLTPPRLEERSLAGDDPNRAASEVAVTVMIVLLFTAISFYGSQLLTGVVEEKSSRVVEVLLAHMSPRHLLAGKVLGIGLLGLGQLLLVAVVAAVTAAAVDAVDIPQIRVSMLAWLLVWFLLGYALWSVAYGALGALASRSEDAQAVSAPATIVLVAVYVFALTALYDPDSLSSRVASLIPVTAPLVMPIRIARGEVALWEVALALALTAAAIYALVRLGGRVYAGAVLRTGAKVRLRDAWRFGGPDIAGRATSRAGTGG